MRLSEAQVSHIVQTVKSKLSPLEVEIYLYGSRTRNHLSGGDIDLLFLATQQACEVLHKKKYEILVDIKKSPLIGDRRIDLVIATPEDLKTQPFLQVIVGELVRLG